VREEGREGGRMYNNKQRRRGRGGGGRMEGGRGERSDDGSI